MPVADEEVHAVFMEPKTIIRTGYAAKNSNNLEALSYI